VESSIGLYFYGARWYDASIGRFTSADSIVPNPGDPVAFDRYAYVRNSPVNYTDPTGHSWYYDPGADALRIVRDVLNVDNALMYNKNGERVAVQKGLNDFVPTGYHNGFCGAVTVAAIIRTRDPYFTANELITTVGTDTANWSGAGDVAKMFETYGWETRGGNQEISLSGTSSQRRQQLESYQHNGWYAAVRVWTNSSGQLLTNNGVPLIWDSKEEKYYRGDNFVVGHWIWVKDISADGMVTIFNPAVGEYGLTWDEFYSNVSINWYDVNGEGPYTSSLVVIAWYPKSNPTNYIYN
jgi:RHS repeat-associated protein